MYEINNNWITYKYDGTDSDVTNTASEPVTGTTSGNGYVFALTNRTNPRGWDIDCNGTVCAAYGLQVSKACPFDVYSDVNDVVGIVLGKRPVDLYTKEITMSDGSEGREYGLRLYPHDGDKSLSKNAVEAEDAIRKYMLDRGFVEITPTQKNDIELKFDFSNLKTILDAITVKAEKKLESRGKSLVSRLMK